MSPEEAIALVRERISSESLGEWPTPVRLAQPLSRELRTDLWIKDDGLSSPHYGGNKVRKLEFALAAAKESGAHGVLTFGGIGSNHAIATTVHARRVGLESDILVVDQPLTEGVRRNLLLNAHLKARLHYRPDYARAVLALPLLRREIEKRDGVAPAVIPPGASSPTGSVGYALAAMELKAQIENGELPPPDAIFVAAGSCGTVAGLLAGAALLGWNLPLHAVRVVDRYVVNGAVIGALARATLGRIVDAVPELVAGGIPRYRLEHGYFGAGYGAPTPAAREAVEAAAQAGLKLETTYTGKTLAAAMDTARARPGSRVLFWNTFNAADFSDEILTTDYKMLPKQLWKFFDGRVRPV